MTIDTSSSSMAVTSSQSVNQNSSSVSSKTSSDTSFKDEMDKVTSTETKTDEKKDIEDTKDEQKDKTVQNSDDSKNSSKKLELQNKPNNEKDEVLKATLTMNNISQTTFNNINQMLIDDIEQMANVQTNFGEWNCTIGNMKFSLSMNETDAQFFIDLTSTNDMSAENMASVAQNMLNSGANVREVTQGYQVSQALLNALSESRQNNQPIRIDFDQNIAVILRVNQNGSLSANFIPGDKIVEQYLRQNIDLLRNSFDEKNLPYTDLSYSNSSKEQNKRRRSEQQGE